MSSNGTHKTVEIGAVYECAAGERFSVLHVATDQSRGRAGQHLVIYFAHSNGETLARTIDEWCEDVDGRPRFWIVEGGGG